jgi:nicotinamidase/pyrazinamidase
MNQRAALLVVDVQSDFCPGGALPVPNGDQVVSVLNKYIQLFVNKGWPVFASRDWHPEDSRHFQERGGIWPVHCVQGSQGARFHPQLRLPKECVVVSKGTTPTDDGYSAMQGVTLKGIRFKDLLHELGVERLYMGGLATDYCVKQSALEALDAGLRVTVLTDAVQGVEVKAGDTERAMTDMVRAGADLGNFESVGASLAANPSSAGNSLN